MMKTIAKVLMVFLLVAALLGAFDAGTADTASEDSGFSMGIVQDVAADGDGDGGRSGGGGDGGTCEGGSFGC